jgi:uncharacterized protein YegL
MKTYLALVIDRSGSMYSLKVEAQNGINKLIEDQKKVKMNGKMGFLLVDFDNEIEIKQSVKDIAEAKNYILSPRASTSLWDAIHFTVNETKQVINKLRVRDRPKTIMCVVVTDGQDNASKMQKSSVTDLVENLKKEGWDFTFMCNNPIVQREGQSTGMTSVQYSDKNTQAVYNSLSQKVIRTRNSLTSSNFTANELKSMR